MRERIKNKNMKQIYLTIISLVLLTGTLSAQENGLALEQIIHTDDDCVTTVDLRIALEDPSDPEWDLPYEIDITNLAINTDSYYDMEEATLTIPDLAPGEYEILVYLTEECTSTIDVTIADYSADANLSMEGGHTCGMTTFTWTSLPTIEGFNLWQGTTLLTYEFIASQQVTYAFEDVGDYKLELFYDMAGEYCPIEFEFEIKSLIEIESFTNLKECKVVDNEVLINSSAEIVIKNNSTSTLIYEWKDEEGNVVSTTQNLATSEMGLYTLTATTSDGCSATLEHAICCCFDGTVPGQPSDCYVGFYEPLGLNVTLTNPEECDDTGSMRVTSNGGKGTILLTVTGPSGYAIEEFSSDPVLELDLENLELGSYEIIATDGCSDITEVHTLGCAEACEDVDLEIAVQVSRCGSILDGIPFEASITMVTGGVGPYTYKWQDLSASSDYSDLYNSSPSVTVTDNFGCSESITINIPAASDIPLSMTLREYGACELLLDGNIDFGDLVADVSGGTGPFSVAWSTGASYSWSPSNLQLVNVSESGTYSATVTDACGSMSVSSIDVECTEEVDDNGSGGGGGAGANCQLILTSSNSGRVKLKGRVTHPQSSVESPTITIKNSNGIAVKSEMITLSSSGFTDFEIDISDDNFIPSGGYSVCLTSVTGCDVCRPFIKTPAPPSSGCTTKFCKFTDPTTNLVAFVRYCESTDGCFPYEYYVADPGGEVSTCDQNCVPHLVVPSDDCETSFINAEHDSDLGIVSVFVLDDEERVWHHIYDPSGQRRASTVVTDRDPTNVVGVSRRSDGAYTIYRQAGTDFLLETGGQYGQTVSRHNGLVFQSFMKGSRTSPLIKLTDTSTGLVSVYQFDEDHTISSIIRDGSSVLFADSEGSLSLQGRRILSSSTNNELVIPVSAEVVGVQKSERGYLLAINVTGPFTFDQRDYATSGGVSPFLIWTDSRLQVEKTKLLSSDRSKHLLYFHRYVSESVFVITTESSEGEIVVDCPDYDVAEPDGPQPLIDSRPQEERSRGEFTIEPNPFRNNIILHSTVSSAGKYQIVVRDIYGKVVVDRAEMHLAKGFTSSNISLQHLPSGMYVISISDKGGANVSSFKAIKVH